MNQAMASGMVDVLVRNHPTATFDHQRLIETLLVEWYEGPLKKDKFIRKQVKESIIKLNPSFAAGYFKIK